MEKHFLQATLKRNGDVLEFIASDETLDRQGEVIPIESWDLRNYKKNPVLLVNHDYKVENIVGKASKVRVEGKELKFVPIFHGLTQLAKDVEAMVGEGLLNTVSVGFMPVFPKKNGDKVMNELLEISFVPVPANPSASRISRAMEEMQGKEVDEVLIKGFVTEDKETEEVVDEPKEAEEEKVIETAEELKEVMAGEAKSFIKLSSPLMGEILAENEKLQKALIDATPKEAVAGRSQKNSNKQIAILKQLAREINVAIYKSKRNT